jgi:hypothetical protein
VSRRYDSEEDYEARDARSEDADPPCTHSGTHHRPDGTVHCLYCDRVWPTLERYVSWKLGGRK